MDDRTAIADLERRLAESEARHRLLIESWAQAVWETDAEGVVVADSPSWRAYTGQTLEEWLGYGWLEAIHPDDRAHAERQWRQAIAERGLVNAEFRLQAPGGGWRWTNVRAAPVFEASGNVEKWLGLNIDIHERKQAETGLSENEARYRMLFEAMDEAYAVVEVLKDETGEWSDFRFVEVNPAFLKHTSMPWPVGKTAKELLGTPNPRWTQFYGQALDEDSAIRVVEDEPTLGRIFDLNIFALDRERNRVAVLFTDVTESKQAELVLCESEERQAFLLKLSDAMRAEPNADTVADRAIRMLAEQMRLDRCYLATYRLDDDQADITHQFGNDQLPQMPETIRLSDFPEAFRVTFDSTLVVDDVRLDERLSADDTRNMLTLGFGAFVAPTPRKGPHRPLWVVVTVSAKPRRWTQGDIALVEEAAERIWAAVERTRSEAALQASEARFRQFAAASAAGLWIRDAESLSMEFTSAAIATIYGVDADALLGEVTRWAATIVPEDRKTALEHLDKARQGEVAVHEFRIQRPSDGAFRWIKNTDFPLRDGGQIPRIGGIAEDVTEAKLAAEHTGVLLAELQHRVRNTMAVIRAITARTGESAASVVDYAALMSGRLLTLARVQALLTRAANTGGGITGIVRDELEAQAQHERQYLLDGPDLVLSPKAAEVLTLAVHELTTNALKYGALSSPQGRVTVRWAIFEKRGASWLGFDWTEEGTPERPPPDPSAPRRRGFGSELIEGRIPYELGGRGKVTVEVGGARCHLEFPLRDGDSILETDAPQRATVFGGAIDMTGEADLSGYRVLVVEDDYYLAADTVRALKGAGAEVLGPCPTEDAARDELENRRPDAAVVDINLGRGPSFKLAEALKDGGIPFVFTTGYDPKVIPAEFDRIERLQKPVQLRQVVNAIAKLVDRAA